MANLREARALIFQFLGGRVPVRPQSDASAILARYAGPVRIASGSDVYELMAGLDFAFDCYPAASRLAPQIAVAEQNGLY